MPAGPGLSGLDTSPGARKGVGGRAVDLGGSHSEGLVDMPILIVINGYRFIYKYNINIRITTTAKVN